MTHPTKTMDITDCYVQFGIVLTEILERNHIRHDELRARAGYGNNILTAIKAGIPKRLEHYNRTLAAAYPLLPPAEAARLRQAACHWLIAAP